MKQIQVLIVDDDANSLRLSLQAMQQLVEPAGIFTASNASETLQILQTQPIALAFLDIDMPDTSGFSIADYIRQHKPDTKYVFLTGYVDFAVRSFDYEPLDFLIKPIDLMRLGRTLERFEARGQKEKSSGKERIAVDTSEGFVLLPPDEIAYIGKSSETSGSTAATEAPIPFAILWTSWRPCFPTSVFSAFTSPSWCPCLMWYRSAPPASARPTRPF